jgi:hypothetical protein
MLMGTMLASVLMVMALSVGAMLMSMGMFVHDCEAEAIHAGVHGCGRAYGNGNLSWVVLL